MSAFCKKVVEYMYENRLNEFLSSFYELYMQYKHLGEENFFREWFDRSIIRQLVSYFPPSVLVPSFQEVKNTKGRLLRTYVKTYWEFCKNPRKYPVRIEEALKFFGLEELSEEALRKRYRELVRQFHPDRAGKRKETHMMMVKVNYYYQVLRRYLSDRSYEAVSGW